MPRCSFSWNKLKELKEKNVIIGEPRLRNVNDTILAREVTLEKTPDGKESLKITVKASILKGQACSSQDSSQPPSQVQPVRPVYPTGQTVLAQSRPNMFKAKRPEVGTWKVNESKVKEKLQSRSSPLINY